METFKNKGNRLYYIDNLRILLISLVVLHHLSITYGAPGGWYYNESKAGFPEIIPLSMFVASNQSFFMGMFFFISAFFILPSLIRKGTGMYFRDRLVRLGIPLLVFYFILNPLTNFIVNKHINNKNDNLIDFIINSRAQGFGPLWFIEALLILTAIYLIIRQINFKITLKLPKTYVFLLAAFLTGVLQFIIRIWLPVGSSTPFTNFQFPFFVQYIFLFVIGIVAYQNNWLETLTYKTGKRWFIFAQAMIFIGFPVLFISGGAASGDLSSFIGGSTWQSLGYSLWEQITGISLIVGLLGLSKKYINKQGKAAKSFSESAYGVFIFHAPVLVGLSAVFVHWGIFPFLKFIVLAPLALISCFMIAFLVKKIPGINKIL